MTDSESTPAGPLAGLTVLDLSRVLAGPWSSQALGDLGANGLKRRSWLIHGALL